MTQQEKEAWVRLLINNTDASVAENASEYFQDRISKRKKRKASELEGTDIRSKYHNLDYIGGSAAKVERLLSEEKVSSLPIVLKCLLLFSRL